MTSSQTSSYIAKTLAIGVGALSLLVMYGWQAHSLNLTQIYPSFTPMKFNTALSFLLCSVAIGTLGTRLNNFGVITSFLAFLLNLLTALQFTSDVDFGIDELFFHSKDVVGGILPGRMAPNTAAGFLMLAGPLFLCGARFIKAKNKWLISAFMASIAVAIGMAPLLGYLAEVDLVFTWANYIRMAVHTALCFVLSGSFLVYYSWQKSDIGSRWLPFPIGLGLVALAVSLSAAVRGQEDTKFQNTLQTEADHIVSEGQAHMGDLYRALDRVAKRWSTAHGTSRALWESDAQQYLNDYPYLRAISNADTSMTVRWLVSKDDAKIGLGFKLTSESKRAKAVEKALATRKASVTNTLTLLTGEKGFLYIEPLYNDDQFDGLQVAVFRIDDLFKMLLKESDTERFYITVSEQDNVLFSNLPKNEKLDSNLQAVAALKNEHVSWLVRVMPSSKVLAEKNSLIPEVVLIIGLFTAFLVTLCVYLALKFKYNAEILKTITQKLEETNELNNAILSSSVHMIIAGDVNGKTLVFNPAAEKALGYSAAEVVNKDTPVIWHEEEEIIARAKQLSEELGERIEPGYDVLVIKALRNGSDKSEWNFIRKDGSKFRGELTVTLLKGKNGEVVGFLGIVEDITLRREHEEALRTSEEKFRSSMQYASIGMALVSPEGKWLQVNDALCNILGCTKSELLQLDFQTITHPDDLEKDLDQLKKLTRGKLDTYQMEKRYFHKTGYVVWALLNVSMVRNPDGSPQYFISQIQDITQRKESEAKQDELIQKLVDSNEELERFAYVASHDMQEPLRMISNFSEILREEYQDKFDEDGKEYLHLMIDGATRMQAMIADLLEYARIGNQAIRLTRVNGMEELKHVEDNLAGIIKETGAKLTSDRLPEFMGNPVQFMRLLQNLIGNGLKYQAPGVRPQIHVGIKDAGTDWIFSVKDNGIGMPQEYIKQIFEPFKRLHTWQEYKGTGIGLAVCKKIVENHRGIIWVTSKIGEGSTFYFTIPKLLEAAENGN